MSKLILDTNIYIDYLNKGKHKELIYINEYPSIILLSSVVLMELYAGAHNKESLKLIDTLKKPFEKRNMIITPTEEIYVSAGHILATLQREKGYDLKKRYSITNDVLIALTTRQMGATLVTGNKKDFMAIKEIKDYSLKVV